MRRRLQNRDGITLVLTAFMAAILIGSAAFAIDMGHLYLIRNEIQNAADAAALAGAAGLGNGEHADALTDALTYDHRNKVDTSANTLASSDVTPGRWSMAGVFTALDWTDPTANAVTVITRYQGYFTFGRVYGLSTKNLTATAIAVHGSTGVDHCIRPWAVPYRDLLDHLPGGTALPISHDLTTTDVVNLRNATLADTIELNQSGTDGAPHQMRAVSFPPMEFAVPDYHPGNPNPPSASDYQTEISEDCGGVSNDIGSRGVSPGDYLVGASGQMTGPTEHGVYQFLCGANSCPSGTPAKAVHVAIWDTFGASTHGYCAATGNNACYHIKYLGIFYLTGYDHAANSVKGYFSSMGAVGGGFSTAIGPITKNGLVK